MQLNDPDFLSHYINSVKFFFEYTPNFNGGVISLDNKILYRSITTNKFGLNEMQINQVLDNPQTKQENLLVIQSKVAHKFLKIFEIPNHGIKALIITKSPIINPSSNNVVAIQGLFNPLPIANLASIFASHYLNQPYSVKAPNTAILTERERQVIFFFLLNFDSETIAKILTKINHKKISKSGVDQVFHKQILPKFEAYSRKELYQKLQSSGFDRMVPQNILQTNLSLDVTDYVLFS